jgi:nucleoside-diphosphate-sugar epimerase
MKILITGASGFVGTNLVNYLSRNNKFEIKKISLHSPIVKKDIFDSDIIIHLAGKAHDLKNSPNPEQYYQVNCELSKKIYDFYLQTTASKFIFISSVKAAADKVDTILTEEIIPTPITDYGKSKLLAEEYIINKKLPIGKSYFILRPCMIHGPGNKGNLNLLYKIVNKGLPWSLGSFDNKRSFCSIDNLCFIINELIENDQIPSGVYNVADDIPLSTNELINLISECQNKNSNIWNVPKLLVNTFAKIGDILKLPLNSERLVKLTESYIVSNNKIKNAINKPFPLSSREGLKKTLNSFKIDA